MSSGTSDQCREAFAASHQLAIHHISNVAQALPHDMGREHLRGVQTKYCEGRDEFFAAPAHHH